MTFVWIFLGGAFLCNMVPHLAAGLRGEAFPTPFAKPPGRGLSPPLVNFAWGSANAAAAVALLATFLPRADRTTGLVVAGIGWLVIGFYLAVHFGAVRRQRDGS